jgi:cell division protein FtsB
MAKKIIPIIIIVCMLAAAGYVLLRQRFAQETREAVSQERAAWQQKADTLEKKVGSLEQELTTLDQELKAQEQGPPVDPERQQEAFGEEAPDFYGKELAAGDISACIQKFFLYIDRKGYLQARGIEGTARDYCRSVIERLRASTPVVSGESQDAYILLKNISFFFRVLGKTEVLLIRDILAGEADLMEQTIRLFYLWLDPGQNIPEPDRITLPLETGYEYAAFFLQTIAGRAYLFRRDSRLRLLVQYYSVLILDRANDAMLNRYGVDIRPPVNSLMEDIRNYRLLRDRQTYLDRLALIKKKAEGIRIGRPAGE